MASIADRGHDLLVRCGGPYNKVDRCPVFRFEPKEIRARFMPDVTMAEIEGRFCCPKCKAPVKAEIVHQWHTDNAGKWHMGRDPTC